MEKLNSFANENIETLTVKELDAMLVEFGISLPSKTPKTVKVMLVSQQIELQNVKTNNESLHSQLSAISKKVQKNKSKKKDQNVAKFRFMFNSKLAAGEYIDVSTFDKSVRSIAFTIDTTDQKYGFSLSQTTKATCVDFSLSYSTGAWLASFGCGVKISPLINPSTGQKSRRYNTTRAKTDGVDYDQNRWMMTLTFADTVDGFERLITTKNGTRYKDISDEKMPTQSTLSIITDNFEKSAAEIFQLVLDQWKKSDDVDSTDDSDDSSK